MQEISLPGVKLKLGTPQQVAEGIGHCWFPNLAQFATGEVLLTHGLMADSEGNLLYAQKVFVSPDEGMTWGGQLPGGAGAIGQDRAPQRGDRRADFSPLS